MPIQVNYYTEVIYITSPTVTVTIQELINAVRTAEDTPEGASFGGPVATLQDAISDAEGKAEVSPGVDAGIIMTLHVDWYIEFWDGVVLGTVKDGNVTGGLASRPVRCAVGSSDTALQLGLVGSTIVGGGGGETKEDIADAVWDEVLTGATHDVAASAGKRLRQLGEVVAGAVTDGAPGVTSFDTDVANAYEDFYADQYIRFTSGNLEGIVRVVVSSTTAGFITLSEDLPVAPENGDDFDLIPVHVHPIDQVASEVWNTDMAGHTVVGSFGEWLQGLPVIGQLIALLKGL
jgi:hypothetical protein